jgi:hypothetical protein
MSAAAQLQFPIEAPTSFAAAPSRTPRGRATASSVAQLELFPTAAIGQGPTTLTLVATAGVDRRPTQRQIVLHHWECTVVSVGEASFTATLRSLRDPSDTEKEAEIPTDEITPDDLELLQRGAVFYWTIGYDVSPGGTRRRSSQVKFRRLPAWTKKDIERVRVQGSELFEMFGKAEDERSAACS